jgi:hypothetical protein
MSVPVPKVEIGFDLTDSLTGPYFRLDDPLYGQLDTSPYGLGGTVFFDVTSKVRSVAIRRGKNRQLDQYDAGLANVVFNNNDRTFDPEFTGSPYFGQIIPKRQIRISSGGVMQFFGLIDDWNLTYEPSGDSIVAAACSDAISQFATQTIALRTNEQQYSGDRVNTILDLSEINWPVDSRDVETGQMLLGTDTIANDTNALSYLRTIEKSEPGSFFISKTGNVTFRDRLTAATSGGLVLADDGTGIPYTGMRVEYGSELLANEVVLENYQNIQVIALDTSSIGLYGINNLTQTGLQAANQSDLGDMAVFFANKFGQPEYRFDAVEVIVDQLPTIQQAEILGLELGSVVKIVFTPNGIAPAIEKYAEIIRIDHAITITNHVVSLGFATLDFTLFVLDDVEFGKLDSNNALAF